MKPSSSATRAYARNTNASANNIRIVIGDRLPTRRRRRRRKRAAAPSSSGKPVSISRPLYGNNLSGPAGVGQRQVFGESAPLSSVLNRRPGWGVSNGVGVVSARDGSGRVAGAGAAGAGAAIDAGAVSDLGVPVHRRVAGSSVGAGAAIARSGADRAAAGRVPASGLMADLVRSPMFNRRSDVSHIEQTLEAGRGARIQGIGSPLKRQIAAAVSKRNDSVSGLSAGPNDLTGNRSAVVVPAAVPAVAPTVTVVKSARRGGADRDIRSGVLSGALGRSDLQGASRVAIAQADRSIIEQPRTLRSGLVMQHRNDYESTSNSGPTGNAQGVGSFATPGADPPRFGSLDQMADRDAGVNATASGGALRE